MKFRSEIAVFLLLIWAVVLTPVAAAAAQGQAQGPPREPMGNLVVILSTDDSASADAAFRIAGIAAKRGHKVTILLRVRALQFAVKDNPYKIGDAKAQDVVLAFMKSGSRVFVGGMCMKLQNITKDKLIDGVTVGTPDSVMGMLFDENTRIICQ